VNDAATMLKYLSLGLLVAVCSTSTVHAWETPAARKAAAEVTPAESAKAKPAAKKKPAGKEVTLKGDLTCAKCGLHEPGACQNVLVVAAADKASVGAGGSGAAGQTVKYYLEKNAVAEANHEKVCGGSVPATVTGRVREEGGKMVITASAVKLD
jgi:hypothetical protein